HGVQPVDGVDNARLAVRQQVQHGADWIKYYSDRRYYFTPDSVLHSWVNFTDAEAKAIVDESHRLGRMVAAHAIGSDGIAAALRDDADAGDSVGNISRRGVTRPGAKLRRDRARTLR